MKTLTKILIGAGVLAIAGGGVALARGPGGCGPMGGPMGGPMRGAMVEKMFERFDVDKDGAVTTAEFLAVAAAPFDKIDANHDGVLDKTEIETWIGRRAPEEAMKHFLAMHDLDGDGKVTKAEFEKPMKKRFALYDRNDDGKVTRDEIAVMAMGKGHGRHHGWGMNGPGHGWQQGGWGPGGMGGMGPGMGGMGPGMGGMGWGPQGGPQIPPAK